MELKRVVVTGIGALTPIGNNLEDYWKNLLAGVSGAAMITLFDASRFKTRFACELKNYDPLAFLDRKEARKLDRFAQLALAVSDQAVTDAGISKENSDYDRVGVVFASGIGGLITFQEEVMQFAKGDGTPRYNPFFIPKMILDIAAGHISIRHGFRGPNFAVVSACASSTNALMESFNLIRLGMADIILTGGSEAVVSEAGVGGFNAMKALSERNESPGTASRPYDKGRDGFVMGEGAGALILEELEHAKARGAKIYCEIAGAGATGDAHHITAPHPEGLGAKNVMMAALRDAQMNPADIDYINTHGTSTPLGDVSEVKAIMDVFGENAFRANISSTKSMTGHECWMAGASEIVYSMIMMQNSFLAPNINFQHPDEESAKLDIVKTARDKNIDVFLSNSFGFGGTNSSLIVRKWKS